MSTGAPSAAAGSQAQLWDGHQLRAAFAAAAAALDANRDSINALNVFPVPDGDTGTNMAMTMNAAVQAVTDDDRSVSDVGSRLAHGALLGARGNSGVILSQIFRGFASGIQGRDELDGEDFARALRGAQEMAYKAVMRPVEGTMLTVIRGAAERATTAAQRTPSLTTVLREAIAGAQDALETTPQLLEILRQAGVVDAGGQGIVVILQGLAGYAYGDTAPPVATTSSEPVIDRRFFDEVADQHGEDAWGYCTNFMIFGEKIDFPAARDRLAAMGQSAVIVGDDAMVKVHIHTDRPGQVLDYATSLGNLDQIKIDNMSRQAEAMASQTAASPLAPKGASDSAGPGAIAIVAVAAGDGLAAALRSMGATAIVPGGQTMNPSTEDLLAAVDRSGAQNVILLPNNKNIVLAANQIPNLTERSVRVVPTTSVPQALSTLAAFNPAASLDDNVDSMAEALTSITTIELTKAVRDVELNGVRIASGQTIGLIDDELAAAGDDLATVAATLFAQAEPSSPELVTVFAGADATETDVAALRQAVSLAYPESEAEFADGGQPHYLFVISVE